MDRTNITNDGYTYNGQNYKNETRVDGQGNNYNVSLPTTIPAEYLAPPKNNPIQVTQPTYNTDALQTQAQQALGYVNGSLQSAEAQATAEAQRQKDAYNSANTDLAKLQSELGGKSADINAAYNQVDQNGNSVNTLASKLRQLSAQSQALDYQKTIIPSQLQNNAAGTGATDRGLAPIEAGQLRNNMIQQATIAMQAAVINADYQSAKGYADQIVDAKYEQRLADIEAKKTNINNIMFNLTDAQKKQADATLQRLNKEQRDYEDLKANEKSISDMVIQASSQNAPQDLVAKAKEAKSPSEAAMILGQYAGDYYKTELLKNQIATEKAQRAKIFADINAKQGVNINGKPLKVSNSEITSLNESIRAKNSVESLITQFKQNIMNNGTQVLSGKAAGDRDALKTNLLLEMKTLAKTGALDQGTIDVLSGTIPGNTFFATEEGQTAALDNLLTTITNKSNEYVESYRGTTAETDPRTKRAYAPEPANDVSDFEATTAKVDTTVSSPAAYVSGFNLIK